MKVSRILLAIALCAVLGGCQEKDEDGRFVYTDQNVDIKRFTYHEHDYMRFNVGHAGNVMHDPDCRKCSKKKKGGDLWPDL